MTVKTGKLVPQATATAFQYAQDIVDGKTLSNKWIKAIAQRFLDTPEDDKYYFDDDAAQLVLNVCSFLKQSKDKWVGKPIILLPFQIFFLCMLFGTKERETGNRRYTNCLFFVARKNGKSTLLAAIAIYCLLKDPWTAKGAEIYCAATKRSQAKIVFDEIVNMIKQSSTLQTKALTYRDRIAAPRTFGKIEPLASEAKSLDGLNPTLCILDELAAHPNSHVYDILRSAQGSRTNPLCISITTAGLDPDSFGAELLNHCKNVAEGISEDDSLLPIVYCLEDDDDPFDETTWIKANPGLNHTITYDYLRKQATEARHLPSSKHNFLIKHLNLFTRDAVKWLDINAWLQCIELYDIFDPEFINRVEAVFLGLDLASIQDMASLSGVCVMKDGTWKTFSKNYLPEDAVTSAFIKGNSYYKEWQDNGLLTTTPGNITDYDYIEADIIQICELLPVRELAFDRFNSSQLITNITGQGIVECVVFSQSFSGMNPAICELERRYLSGNIQHNNNPILNWAMSNAVLVEDPNGNKKLNKLKSKAKIDAAVALVMAVGRAMLHYDDDDTPLGYFL